MLTTRIRSLAPLQVPLATVRSCGQKSLVFAILARCRETLPARHSQLIMGAMLSDTRKVQEVCARFCGLKQMECRISEYCLAEMPAKPLVLTTWALWLGVPQPRPVRTPSS